MRHRKRRGELKVSSAHHRAMRRNLVGSLFEHGQVTTTVAKAKAFKPFAEKLITLARKGNQRKAEETAEGRAAHLHAVRRAAQLLPHKPAVRNLFGKVAPAAAERAGGYTRILRLGTSRVGDNAPLAMLMLVDEAKPEEGSESAEAAKK
ncbi:MAG: 50S ribosomal protein L17 [Planctomycetota bacterium]|jgi:large subunit ribosomal protein L17